jgi:uncharacterized protein (UPF0212 family)
MTSWHSDVGSSNGEQWYEIQVSVPWVVTGVSSAKDAISIAATEVRRRAESTDARSSRVHSQFIACPACGFETSAVLCTTDFAMVVLTVVVEMSAKSQEESGRVAKRELGVRMKDVPLTVLNTRLVGDVDEIRR